MLYREVIAVCCEIHMKYISTVSGQNLGSFNVIELTNQCRYGLLLSLRSVGLYSADTLLYTNQNKLCQSSENYSINNRDIKWAVVVDMGLGLLFLRLLGLVHL
jgi:hypothetical protein